MPLALSMVLACWAAAGLALLATVERSRFDRWSLLGVGAVAGPLTSPVLRRLGRPRPVALALALPASGTMVVLPVGADPSPGVVAALRGSPGPVTVMTVAVSSPTRPDWSGELAGEAWRNAVGITGALGRGVAVASHRGRLDEVARDAATRSVGRIVLPDGAFPASEVARLARRVSDGGTVALEVVGRAAEPLTPPAASDHQVRDEVA